MSHFKKIRKNTKNLFRGLSLGRDEYFLRNLTAWVWVIMIWAGVRWILDLYLVPYGIQGRVVCVLIGILLLYLIDGDIGQLWGKKKDDE